MEVPEIQEKLDPNNCFEGEQDATELRIPFKLDELQSYNNFQQVRLV